MAKINKQFKSFENARNYFLHCASLYFGSFWLVELTFEDGTYRYCVGDVGYCLRCANHSSCVDITPLENSNIILSYV